MGKEEFLRRRADTLKDEINARKRKLGLVQDDVGQEAPALQQRVQEAQVDTSTSSKARARPRSPSSSSSSSPAPTRRNLQIARDERSTTPPATRPMRSPRHKEGGLGWGRKEVRRAEVPAKGTDPSKMDFVGGMRNPFQVVQPMSNLMSFGLRIRAAWEAFVRDRPRALHLAD